MVERRLVMVGGLVTVERGLVMVERAMGDVGRSHGSGFVMVHGVMW